MNFQKTILLLSFSLLIGACSTSQKTLFNGKDLTGWQAYESNGMCKMAN